MKTKYTKYTIKAFDKVTTLVLIVSFLFITSCSAVKDVIRTGLDIYDMDKSYTIMINWLASDVVVDSPFETTQDNSGFNWHQYMFNDSNWQYVKLPDKNWNCNRCDRYYRGYFEITSIGDFSHDYLINVQSDDGIWIYINGKFFGHFGGDVHKEGCVNVTYCSELRKINPLKIDDYLIKGKNVIAVRVSESIGSEYFNLTLNEISLTQTK